MEFTADLTLRRAPAIPYATQAPKLYDQSGDYHGQLSSNPYDPASTSNPYGCYGSPQSPQSVKPSTARAVRTAPTAPTTH